MSNYIRKRLLQVIPVVFGITILTFFIMKLAPGGPLAGMISPRISSESLLRAQEAMGLNKPIIVQYWNWLKELVQGNMGYSTYNGYGMSEIGITSVELRRKPKWRNQNSVGMPFDSVEYKIGEDGVLYVRGSSLCVRKLVNGKELLLEDWFCTGDNMVCRKGNYFILGRKGDMVIGENGENINPDTIEKLFVIEGIKAFSVLGLGSEKEQELSIVIQVDDYVTEEKLDAIDQRILMMDAQIKELRILIIF